ncbi:MAG TPA: Rrf2 family transcriptional regulator [Candidatus Kapabacteria bacterium]|nr:Rrf2 family transcriptional regulator [Candidatus Kapabacteria bacterium]
MLKLPKKVEYAILALQYIAEQDEFLVSTKEISNHLKLSFEFLSKVMQVLNKNGIIQSQQGTKGGYKLVLQANELKLIDVIRAFEENINLVDCTGENSIECIRLDNCSLRKPMLILQGKIERIFYETSIADLSDHSKLLNIKLEY